jgi:alkylation response protein AidB-like acyl-CoA dehydrogenase
MALIFTTTGAKVYQAVAWKVRSATVYFCRSRRYGPAMSATAQVLKPDFRAKPKHFIFTPEHDQLRESIGSFVVKELAPHAEEWEENTFPDWVFRRMGELGFLGLTMPEEYGGQGGDYYCSIVLAEEMTKSNCGGMTMGVAVQTDMAMPPIKAFGTEEQKQEWLVPAIKGEKILCLGITEPDAGSDVAGIKTRAVRDGDEFVINGSKTFITNGHRADVIVLVTKTDPDAGYDGFSLFLVPMDSPGVIREKKLQKMGMHASDTALLAFQDVRVPATAMLGQEGKGFYNIMWELQGERMVGAAGAVASAQRLMERTLQYSLERTAFGRPIGKFQVTRHKFAEMATKIEVARQMVYTTAWRIQNGEYPVREISMAKLYASRIAVEVADECIQIHGGAGYMKEYNVERAWRDLRLNRIGAGTDEIMLEVIGRSYGL